MKLPLTALLCLLFVGSAYARGPYRATYYFGRGGQYYGSSRVYPSAPNRTYFYNRQGAGIGQSVYPFPSVTPHNGR